MINLKCVECSKEASFKDMLSSRDARWFILGIDISENSYKSVCPVCDDVGTKPSKKPTINIKSEVKLINSPLVSYE